MSQNPFFRSSDSQTFMSHSFIPALIYGLKVCYTLKEETFASGKIREIFGRNFREFRELANFGFFARIIFREFML